MITLLCLIGVLVASIGFIGLVVGLIQGNVFAMIYWFQGGPEFIGELIESLFKIIAEINK